MITTPDRKFPFTGNGATTSFPFTGKIFNVNEIQVYLAGVLQVVGFTVTINLPLGTGGNVVFTVAPANGVAVLIVRVTPKTQTQDWLENDADPAVAKEDGFDRAMNIDIELAEDNSRAPHYPITTTLAPTIAVPTAPDVGKFVQLFDINGNFVFATPANVGSLSIPVSLAQGGTGSNFASVDALAAGLNLARAKAGANIVAASTITLPNPLDGNLITITGSTTITAISTGGVSDGMVLYLRFANTPQLTHSSGLQLYGAVNAQMGGGETLVFQLAGGQWRELLRTIPATAANQGRFWRGDGTWQDLPRPEAGRLQVVSGTSLAFLPYKGMLLPVKPTGGEWKLRSIGSAGVVSGNPTTGSNFVNGVASQTLAANTVYLVCVFDNAGALALDFRTTLTHLQDTNTGVEIRTGDDTRTVVGLIRTNATPNFVDSATQRFCISWFNRRTIQLLNGYSADRSTASTTYVELNTEIRIEFLTWSDEAVFVGINGSCTNSSVPNNVDTGLAFDGTTVEAGFESNVIASSGGSGENLHVSGYKLASEGYHFVTVLGYTLAGTATWHSASGSGKAGIRLHGMVRG